MMGLTERIITPVTSGKMPQVAISLTQGESSLLQANGNTTRVNSTPNTNVVADTRGGGVESSSILVSLQGTTTSNQFNNPPNNHSEISKVSGFAYRPKIMIPRIENPTGRWWINLHLIDHSTLHSQRLHKKLLLLLQYKLW